MTTTRRAHTGGVTVHSKGPLFYPDRQRKAPEPLLLHPTLHQTSPTTQGGKPSLNEAEIVSAVCVCVCLHEDASPLGAKEKRADVTCHRWDVPVSRIRQTSGCSIFPLLKKEASLGTSILVGASGEKQEHPCQVSSGRSEHPSKAHGPSSFGSHSIYGARAD